MAYGPHVGDVDHRFLVTVRDANLEPMPLVGPVTLRFQKPDLTTVEKTASLVDGGVNGQAEYLTTSETDLDQAGRWRVQLKDGDGPWRTTVESFRVLLNL